MSLQSLSRRELEMASIYVILSDSAQAGSVSGGEVVGWWQRGHSDSKAWMFLERSFLIPLALSAQLRVVMVSSRVKGLVLMHAIMMILALPPRESLRRRVSLLSRQGMWESPGFLLFSARALMQLPRVRRLLLMLTPSVFLRKLSLLIFSDPARSMMKSLLLVRWWLRVTSTPMRRMAWEREDIWLERVAAEALLADPRLISSTTCSMDCTSTSLASISCRFPRGSSPSPTCCFGSSASRSRRFSLQISRKLNLSSACPPSRSTCSFCPNRYSQARQQIPRSRSSLGCPKTEQVFPEPVMPQARTVQLQPLTTPQRPSRTDWSKRAALLTSLPKTCEQQNWRIFFSEFLYSWSQTETALWSQETVSCTLALLYFEQKAIAWGERRLLQFFLRPCRNYSQLRIYQFSFEEVGRTRTITFIDQQRNYNQLKIHPDSLRQIETLQSAISLQFKYSQNLLMFQFLGEDAWQYGIVIGAFAVLLAIKAFVLKGKYDRELDQFVHPSIFLEEIKKKVKSREEAEEVLLINLNSSLDHQRLRNIAILVALLNSEKHRPRIAKAIKTKLGGLAGLSPASTKYVNYVLDNTQDWE